MFIRRYRIIGINNGKKERSGSPRYKRMAIATTRRNTVLSDSQKKLFVKYYPIVRKIVNALKGKLPLHADLDELHSAGVSGLADAVRRLDPSRRDSFDGYVATRVRGAIIDELRNLDYMSRSARSDAKQIERLREELEQRNGRAPTDGELRRAMGVDEKRFEKIMRRTRACSFVSLNDTSESSDSSSAAPFAETIADEHAENSADYLERREMAENVRNSLRQLPEKQRRVLEGYYFQDKKLGEIAREFGLTEARICQIHSQALGNLRPKFTN